jgi:hypothetical protein
MVAHRVSRFARFKYASNDSAAGAGWRCAMVGLGASGVVRTSTRPIVTRIVGSGCVIGCAFAGELGA